MDNQHFASRPSASTWEEPGWRDENVFQLDHVHNDDDGGSEPVAADSQTSNDRRAALMEAASQLNTLCASGAPVADVQAFLARWEDPSPSSLTPPFHGRIQPNALAWFRDTNAVQWACSRNDRALLHALLERGLHPTPRAAAHAVAKWRETRDREILQLLVDFGLDLNQPIDDNTPPVMRLVFTHLERSLMLEIIGSHGPVLGLTNTLL